LPTSDNFIQKNNAEMIVGAVVYKPKQLVSSVSATDLLSLQQ
jgi:hypothetical protein